MLLAGLHRATHPDRDICHAALDLLGSLSSITEHKAVETLCDLAAEKGIGWSLWADLSMDGARALPSLLRKAAAEERERGRRSTEGGDPLVSLESPLRPIDKDLLRCAARMLKGVVVDNVEDQLVVTTGLSPGGRTRSYSVGAAADVTLLSPYPTDMM